MRVLLKGAEIVDKNSSHHRSIKNVLIEDGIIKNINNEDHSADIIIDSEGLMLSIGWFDMRTTIGEPGFEHKEDIESICAAAAAGGFTEIASLPNTQPVVQSKNVVSFIKSKCREELVKVHPMAAVTHNREGKEITEMMDLHFAGAVAFTDGDLPVWHSDVLLKTLQYLQTFDGLLINHAEDNHISHFGQMNESLESNMLGLKGIPKIAEELMVERDLSILKYTGGKIHFAHVSSPKSLKLIKQAKSEGLSVTCDIAAYQLMLDDTLVQSFDTNLKVNPPLRTRADIELLKEGVASGIVDAIVSDHIPQDVESKNLEFDLAEFGMIGLETAFGTLNNALSKVISIEQILDKIAYAPRTILKVNIPTIEVDSIANLTLFDPNIEWVFEIKHIKSKSKNTPFVGQTMKGRAKAVFHKNKYIINY